MAPPREQQVEEDLSRLLAAARDNAHGSPSSYASKQPGPEASSRQAEFPLTATAGDELSARRAGRIASLNLGRAAAASVAALVLGVGVSHAAGGPVTFDTFFGRDAQVIADGTDPNVAAPLHNEPDDAESDPSNDAGADAGDEVEDLDAEEPTALELPDDDATAADEEPDAEAEPDTDGDADPTEAPASDDGDEAAEQPQPSPGDDDGADEAEDTVDDVTGGEQTGEILAGPSDPPDDPPAESLDGFGGGQECEGDDLATCMPVGEDEGGPTVGEGDEDADAEDLASRRFRPDDDEDDEDADSTE